MFLVGDGNTLLNNHCKCQKREHTCCCSNQFWLASFTLYADKNCFFNHALCLRHYLLFAESKAKEYMK